MIKIREYESQEDALNKITTKDQEYTFVKHDFKEGKIIKTHDHEVDEWVIVDSGECELTLGLETQVIKPNKGAFAIYLPKKNNHRLRCLTDISYLVLRDKI